MAYSRNKNREKFKNNLEQYYDIVKEKELDFINQFETLNLKRDEERNDFSYFEYTWKINDKLYKLAQRYYQDPKLWWVIGQINNKPTDQHLFPGDIIKIPYANSLNDAIKYLGY